MNREILFKAKRIDNDQWVEGYYAKLGCGKKIKHFIIQNVCLDENNMYFYDIEIDINTLCQYTGLTDKNGKKIWENDIISISAYSYYEPEDDYFGIVTYCEKDACWALKNNERFDEIICECFGSYTTEIINHGNVFDNADLLEVE